MKSLLNDEHISIFCKVLNIDKNKVEEIYVNPGRSANNENYVLVVDGKSYLYRVPGKGTDLFCSREREALIYEILAPINIADEVIFLDKETGVKISKYYENSRIPDSNSKEELKASMQMLKKLHESNIKFDYVDTLFDRVERYKSFALEVGGDKFYLEGYKDYLEQMNDFKEYMGKEDTLMCFTHGDASINNLLITKEYNYPILIDMEFPAMGDPYGDIATFCIDAGYRKDNIVLILEYYLGRKPTQKEEYHLIGLCAVAGMMWYQWAVYKSAVTENNRQYIDFRNDYHQYIGEIFAELNKYD